jgi:hypothetical protein
MGGTPNYWRFLGLDFLEQTKATVTILNVSSPDVANAEPVSDRMQSVVGDACDLPQYPDNHFDITHSNSVIEHVGTWANMKKFASETRRLAACYYVQTPYFWFPVDPHYYRLPFYHWLPRSARAGLLNALPIAHVGKIDGVDAAFEVIDNNRLLDKRQFRFLFPDARITFERLGGLPKSLISIRSPE